jgi:hypothetical protein
MGTYKQLTAHCTPSTMLKQMLKHTGDVSESSKTLIMAERIILGKKVTFYHSGLRVVEDEDLSEDDEYCSEILRLAHASLLINDAVGDKRICYVDARVNPVEVIVYGTPANVYVKRAKKLIETNQIECDFVLNTHLRETREKTDVGNVRLFGR